MLGKTVPEPTSSGRVFVCSAGVSPQLQSLIRVYPLARFGAPQRWQRCEITLERNPRDSRWESWQIAGDRSPEIHDSVNERFHVLGTLNDRARPDLLKRFVFESIAEANRLQQSLAIIEPKSIALEFVAAKEHDEDSPQLRLFDLPDERPSKPTARFKWIPRLVFRDGTGMHNLMLRDWGAYELMRKKGDDYAREHLRAALQLSDDCSLLVGNQANRRTSWLAISVLLHVRAQAGLFDRMESERPFVPTMVRRRVWTRDEGTCQNCGRKAQHLDHIFPVSRGGQSTEANLQALCADCNLAKSNSVTAGTS
jgi:hypothetical protein